ncbi:MAG: TonB-dependent receptor plug domain-containing protein, partial [Alphaproteobacteria bacterium]
MRIRNQLLLGSAIALITAPAFAATQDPPPPPPGTSGPTAEESVAQQADQPLAQTSGDDIIVTATKRASTVQDVPFSVNAQTEEDIQRANAQTLEDISRNVAGLTVQNLGPGQSQVSVRGVSAGHIARDQPGVKEQVGIYLDETITSLSLFTPDFDLFDLNRIETLRGPQGTLFGAGSVGGTLRYITNQPELGRTEGMVEGDVNFLKGGDIGYGLKGAINVPLGQTAAIRAVAYGTKFGGFIDSVGPYNKKNVNDGHRIGTRVSLLWEPTDNLRVTPRVVYQEVEAGGFNREDHYILFNNQFVTGGNTLGKREQYLKFREKFRDETLLADLVVSYDFGPVELTSVTSYVDRDILVSRDASALTGSVYVSFAGAAPAAIGGAALNSNLVDTTKLEQFTQEVRLSSTGQGPLQWVVGGFYSHVDRQYSQRLPTPGSDPF